MQEMFPVRSSPRPAPHLGMHTLRARNAFSRCVPPGPRLTQHRMPSLQFSAANGVQPTSELRYVWRHKHAGDVLRALLPVPSPCPAPNLLSSPPLHAAYTAVARRLPPPGSLPRRTRTSSLRPSAGHEGV
eukprot:scaffold73363_cov60-Phaeocystis_antarctica.AAC.6